MDCNNAIDFLKTLNKMCEFYRDRRRCDYCPLYFKNNKSGLSCFSFYKEFPVKAIKILDNWENSQKNETYLENFLSGIKNARIDVDGYPKVAPCEVYNIDDVCSQCKGCWSIWNMEIGEKTTK